MSIANIFGKLFSHCKHSVRRVSDLHYLPVSEQVIYIPVHQSNLTEDLSYTQLIKCTITTIQSRKLTKLCSRTYLVDDLYIFGEETAHK